MNNSSPAPAIDKPANPLSFSYLEIRSKIFKSFLWGTAAAGLFMLYSLVGHTSPAIFAGFGSAYLLLLTAAFAPLPHTIKAWILAAVIFGSGLFEIFQTGIYGNSRVFFLAFIILTVFLFEGREFLISLGLVALTTIGMGWLLMAGVFSVAGTKATVGSLPAWIAQSIIMILVALGFEEGWKWLRKEYFVTEATLKNAMSTLSNERVNLETRISERVKETSENADAHKNRADRLRIAGEIMQSITMIQEPDELLKSASDLIRRKYNLYHVGIYLNDEEGAYTVLRGASGAGGERLLDKGYRVKIDQSGIVNYAAASGLPRISKRAKDDILFESNPELPETRSFLALPLQVNQRTMGVLNLESNAEAGVSERDLEVMSLLANQLAITIQNTRIASETRRALSEARVVYGHYMRQAWEKIATEKRTVGYRYAGSRVDALESPLDVAEAGTAGDPGQTTASMDEKPNVTIPLKLRDEVIGVLDIRSNNPARKWNENEMAVIQAIAERVSLALENARLFEETTRRADRERTVSEISTHIRSTTDPQVMLNTALEELKRALGAKDIRIRPYSPPLTGQHGE